MRLGAIHHLAFRPGTLSPPSPRRSGPSLGRMPLHSADDSPSDIRPGTMRVLGPSSIARWRGVTFFLPQYRVLPGTGHREKVRLPIVPLPPRVALVFVLLPPLSSRPQNLRSAPALGILSVSFFPLSFSDFLGDFWAYRA